ncbi:MAG: UDP-N-acetylmuramoyl-L-alanine--D-glutamate ligase [Simkania sp.]|nr:UDP-N-acetylmuramoyl-L-alanine--D-glutamate ligase [Simkania sp.]
MQTALVLGLGVSGKAACQLLLKKGYHVIAVDDRMQQCPEVEALGVRVFNTQHIVDLDALDLVVSSPGIAPTHPIYQQAILKHIPVMGEAQLGLKELSQPCIGITGTNGKTTVTSMVTHILHHAQHKARSLGNIGESLCLYALSPKIDEILVIELSSYQLETMNGEMLDTAVILNITPDHLDRYGRMKDYAKAKWNIQHCLKKEAPLIVYDKVLEEWKEFQEIERVIAYTYPSLVVNLPEEYTRNGRHDGNNLLAAWLLVKKFGVTEEQFIGALKEFKKPSHRIEYVATIGGVQYFDDSKGTNLDAVARAVEAMNGPVWLIAGGVDKGASYAFWKEAFKDRVVKIFALGEAKEKISREVGVFCEVEEVESLEQAIRRATREAASGSNVLLSPGCSSFDMFIDYAHRGDEFQRIVRSIEEERRKEII